MLPGGFSDIYDGFRILTVGRLTSQKAYEIAVDAMYKVKKQVSGPDGMCWVRGTKKQSAGSDRWSRAAGMILFCWERLQSVSVLQTV